MSQYKIVIDSCGELPEDLKADGHFCTVPLLLDVDGYQITDDETFNPASRKTDVRNAQTDPFPLVPATWINGNPFCGCPIFFNIIPVSSTPGRFPNRLPFSI